MISKIHVYSDNYYYKNIEYSKNELGKLIKKIRKNRKIILYSETIFVKKYIYPKIKIEKYMEDRISEDFKNKDNFLFHYEVNKESRTVYLYSLRNDKIKGLYKDAVKLSIEPIQFIIKNIVVKKYKKRKNIFIIYKMNNIYNLLFIVDSLMVDVISTKESNEIKEYIDKNKNKESILVADKFIKEDKDVLNLEINYLLDLGVRI